MASNGERRGEKPKYRLTARAFSGYSRDGKPNYHWHRVGAAWEAFSRETGVPYLSIKVETLPVNFDGTLALHEITEQEPGDQE